MILTFDAEGASRFSRLTGLNIDNVVVLHVANQVIMAPRVQGKIETGKMQITEREDQSLKLLKILLSGERLKHTYSPCRKQLGRSVSRPL